MRKSLVAAAVMAVGLAVAVPAKAEQFINVLTGGTSGVYYPLGVALSKIYSDTIKDAKVSVQSTKASVENLNLLQAGRGEVAFSLGDSVSGAWNGDAEAGFAKKLDKLRGISALYPNFIQIVASKDSGIKTLADLKGKRVSVGAPKSGTELNARKVFAAAGLSYSDLGKVEYLPFGESVELMKNRQLDATLQSAGLGVASIRDLSTAIPIVIVEVPSSVVEKIGDPAFIAATIPADTYTGQPAPANTVAVINFLVSTSAVPDDVAYQLTKAMFDNKEKLVAAHSAAKQIMLENATKGMPVPLHPGAEKFYREAGVLK
ncbi:MAG: TAXI family TRAP transporter solute-binding subunit [Rhodospirillales bacterium]|nr:TAXI family TRAP transporter solute-binding subunit [Rhodospirillales bacterium]